MSTREKLLHAIGLLSDEQIEGLYAFLNGFYPDEITNADTLAAFAEVEEMKKNPDDYKGYTDLDTLFKDLSA